MRKIITENVNISELDFKKFPSTRYQGSKRKILPWIYDKFKDLEFSTCLDAFGGSGSVSYLFKKMNKEVTYNDKLKFNYLIGKALIENQAIELNENDLEMLKNGVNDFTFIQDNFKNIYFLDTENKWIDKTIGNIISMNHYSSEQLEYKKAIAYYALFQACLIKRPFNLFHRKNLNLRINNVERSFGNKITWDKPFNYYLKEFTREANSLIFKSEKKCFALNKSVFDIDEDFDLVYLDPPYLSKSGSNETANYLNCYHFLEGLSLYSNWNDLINRNTLNLTFKNPSNIEFTSEVVYETFEKLFLKFKKGKIVLSYKKGGIPSISFLVALMRKFKKNVYTHSKHYSYALNNQNGNKKLNREVLIIGI